MRDPYYRWQAGSTLPCSKIDIVNTAEYLEHHQSNLNPKKKEKKVRDPHFRWQAGSSLPCHSFHRMWVSGASITTLNHKKRALVLSDVQCILNVPPSWSFVNGLLNHVVKELNVEEALKSPILVVQKTAAPKFGVEFRQGSNGTIWSSLATSYDVSRRRATSQWESITALISDYSDSRTHRPVNLKNKTSPSIA